MVRIWDPVAGELIGTLRGHTAGVWHVSAFTHDGRTLLASSGDESMLHVWDPEAMQSLRRIPVHLLSHIVEEVVGQLVLGLSAGLLAITLAPGDAAR
jgi:WD40 repeat protein